MLKYFFTAPTNPMIGACSNIWEGVCLTVLLTTMAAVLEEQGGCQQKRQSI